MDPFAPNILFILFLWHLLFGTVRRALVRGRRLLRYLGLPDELS